MSINSEALTLFRRADTVPEWNWGLITGCVFCALFWFCVISWMTKG